MYVAVSGTSESGDRIKVCFLSWTHWKHLRLDHPTPGGRAKWSKNCLLDALILNERMSTSLDHCHCCFSGHFSVAFFHIVNSWMFYRNVLIHFYLAFVLSSLVCEDFCCFIFIVRVYCRDVLCCPLSLVALEKEAQWVFYLVKWRTG